MGDRANFVIVRNRQRRIYYSHWGASSIPQDIFFGPEATLRYIESLDPVDELSDEAWCQGAVLLDCDSKKLLFYGGDKLASSPALRRHFLSMLQAQYAGWKIEWAHQGIIDVAAYIGYDRSKVEITQLDHFYFSHPDDIFRDAEIHSDDEKFSDTESRVGIIITVKYDENNIFDYAFSGPLIKLTKVLSIGPSLLDRLKDWRKIELPNENGGVEEGAYIDPPNKVIWAWWGYAVNNRFLHKISQFWPGWTIKRQTEGFIFQVEQSGRSNQFVKMRDADIIPALEKILSLEDEFDFIKGVADHMAEHHSHLIASVNPYFTKYPRPNISPENKRRIIEERLRKYRRKIYYAPSQIISTLIERVKFILFKYFV